MGVGYSGESPWRRSRIVVPVASPGAGLEWSLTVPAGHLYQVHSIFAILTTSAVVAARFARLILGDGVAPFLEVPPFASQAASLAWRYSWADVSVAYQAGLSQLGVIPPTTLEAGWTIGSSSVAIDPGDQWSGIRIGVLDVTIRPGANAIDAPADLTVELVGVTG